MEVAAVPGTVGVRDSKYPDGGHLQLEPAGWARLIRTVKTGTLDL